MLNFIVESSKRNVPIIDELTLPELISSNIPLLILVEKSGSAQSAGSLLDHFHQLAANSSIKGRVNFASYEVADNFLGKILLTKWKLRKSLLPAVVLMYLPKCSVFVKYTDDKIKKKDLIKWVDDTLTRPQTAHTLIRELERDFRNELPKPGNVKTSAKVTDEL